MPEAASGHLSQIDQFFAGPGARADQWRDLVELAEAWSNGPGTAPNSKLRLRRWSRPRNFTLIPASADGRSARPRCRKRRIGDCVACSPHHPRHTDTVLPHNPGDWEAHEDDEGVTADVLPPTLGRGLTSTLFRGPDRHRRAGHALARAWRGVAPAAPTARCVRL